MPSIRIYTDQVLMDKFAPLEIWDIIRTLRESVAELTGNPFENTEIMWFIPALQSNVQPLTIEVLCEEAPKGAQETARLIMQVLREIRSVREKVLSGDIGICVVPQPDSYYLLGT